jgi:hypothetical protein
MNDLLVHFRSSVAKRVIEHGRPVDDLRQLLVKLANRERLVGTVVGHRAFDARAVTGPDFLFQVSGPHKQRELLVPRRRDDGNGLRLFEPGQIKEI